MPKTKPSLISIPQMVVKVSFRMACSHEPGTVNYPGVMIAPGKRYLVFT